MRRKHASPDVRIARIAAHQHGVVTIRQLRTSGLSEAGARRRVAAGRLHRIHRGVYAVGHPGLTDRGRWKAATLACGDGCALSHRSAGELWGVLDAVGGIAHVTVPVAGGRATRDGLRIHRAPGLVASLITARDNIRVTRPRRTLDDLKPGLTADELRAALRRAELLGLPLDGFGLAGDRTESELELTFLRLCRRFGMPTPETQVGVGPFRVDFLWRGARLIVETDGYRYHRGSVAFEEDRARDAHLTALGYTVVRFTHRQVVEEPRRVASLLRRRLAGQL